jgi:hypothetical protein
MPLFTVLASLLLTFGSLAAPSMANAAPSIANAADNRVSPDIFLGQYNLKKDVYGLCDPYLQVIKMVPLSGGDLEIYMGRYDFLNVNQPRRSYDDGLATGWYESYTTADSKLVYNGHDKTTANGEYTDDKTVAILSKDKNTLHIVYRSFSDIGGDKFTTVTECIYTRAAAPTPMF